MKSNPIEPSEFATRDIYVATILKLSGIPILRVENHSGRGIFVFKGSKRVQEVVTQYFNSELMFEPRGLFETWKSLKAMAFSTVGDVR